MKKIIKFVRSNILGLLVGLSLCLNGVIIAENMLSSEQVSYSNDKTSETTVKGNLDELFSAVNINERLGSTDISSIGDGTVTGAIDTLDSNLTNNATSIATNTNAITELKNISGKYIAVTYNGQTLGITFYKYGRVCMAYLNNNISSGSANSEVVIGSGSIPEEYRPIKDVKVLGLYNSGGTLYYSEIKFTTSGNIVVKNNTAGSISVTGYKLTYITVS